MNKKKTKSKHIAPHFVEGVSQSRAFNKGYFYGNKKKNKRLMVGAGYNPSF